MTVKLLVAYDGTPFAGWQRQSPESEDKRPTVQGTLEEALSKIFATPIHAQSSGRTDAGAHAEGQVVHFHVPLDPSGEPIRDLPNMKLARSLNALTPPELAILKVWIAPDDFHALRSAEKKTYRYVIHNSLTPNPLKVRYSYWFQKNLSVEKLNSLTECLIGEHDFKSFQTSGTELKTTVRQIYEAWWQRPDENTVLFRITGNGFLKQMVRNIVGTSLYLHQNDLGPSYMAEILHKKDRSAAKDTAPAHGLFLESVYYPASLDNKCREL